MFWHPCAGGGDLPEIVRLCAVFSPAGGRLRAAAACRACTLSRYVAGSVLRLRLRRPHRSVGKRAVLRRTQRAGRFGAAASAHPLPAGGLVQTLIMGQGSAPAAVAGAVLSGLAGACCGKLQHPVQPGSAHAARADRLCPAGVRGVLHHGLRGLPPDRKESTKRSSNKQKLLCGLQTAAKCGNITLGYHITKRSDGESRRCLHGKERSFTG